MIGQVRREVAMVGRDAELAAIRAAFAQPDLGVVLVCGPTGVGKSRLVLEALRAARADALTTHELRACPASRPIPFGALVQAWPGLVSGDRLQVLAAVTAAIDSERLQRGAPRAVVAVDDADQLDDAGIAVLHHLAVTGTALVVATTPERLPDRLACLGKLPHVRVDVGELDRRGSDELVSCLLSAKVPAHVLALIHRITGGNPLYVGELVRGATACGDLYQHEGRWEATGSALSSAPLTELVAARVARLGATTEDLVELLAYAEPLPADCLDLLGIEEDTVLAVERSGVVSTRIRIDAAPGTERLEVVLAHPVYAATAPVATSVARRRALARRLCRSGAVDLLGDPVRAALWHLDAGLPAAPGAFARAAALAEAALDLPLALRFAIATTEPEAAELVARVMICSGRPQEADDYLRSAYENKPTEPARSRLATMRAWNLTFQLDRADDAERVLAELEAANRADPESACLRAHLAAYAGAPAAARRHADLVLTDRGAELLDGDRDSISLRALAFRCDGELLAGDADAAVVTGLSARAEYRARHGANWSFDEEEIAGALATAKLYAGAPAEAEDLIRDRLGRCEAAGWLPGVRLWSAALVDALTLRGDIAAAIAVIDALDTEPLPLAPYAQWLSRAVAGAAVRAYAQAGRSHPRGSAALGEPLPACLGALEVWAGSARAWVSAALGDLPQAVQSALTDAERARAAGQNLWELMALHQVVRWGQGERVAGRLGELSVLVTGPLPRAYAAHGMAIGRRDAVGVEEAGDRFEACGALLLAAEAYAQATVLHRGAERRRAALAASARADGLLVRCPGADTPALAALSNPVWLTGRETEICRLAVAGFASRAIADRLSISVRTVDNTLGRAYAKLGITSRTELAARFGASRRRTVPEAGTPVALRALGT